MEDVSSFPNPKSTDTREQVPDPGVADPPGTQPQHSTAVSSSSSSSSSSHPTFSASQSQSPLPSQVAESEDARSDHSMETAQSKRLQRPALGGRKSSGSIIIPRDSSVVEVQDEEYDADDARAMSPRRSSGEIDRMGDDARQALEQQAHALQSNLLEIIERVDSVKSEHEKLEGGNKFLQSYIGELMQTSKITSAGAPKPKKGRGNK